jgi:hypothetical protein
LFGIADFGERLGSFPRRKLSTLTRVARASGLTFTRKNILRDSFEFAPSVAPVLVRKALQFTYPASGCYDLSSTPRSPDMTWRRSRKRWSPGPTMASCEAPMRAGTGGRAVVRYRSRQ